MEQRTVVAAFNDSNTAQSVVAELERFGVSRDRINVHSNASTDGGTTASSSTHHEGGFTGWLKSLFGTEEEDTDYHRAYQSGNTIVSVDADDNQIDGVVDIIDRYNPVDMQEKSATASAGGAQRAAVPNAPAASASAAARPAAASGTAAASAGATGLTGGKAGSRTRQDETSAVPVVEEDLNIGKREIRRGGVRVISRQIQKPVEKTVELRDEHVFVDRQPVNRAATAADLDPKAQQVIEVEEFAEEPVIEKRARVVEEVRVGKTITERNETVRDNVRSTQVDVEQLNETAGSSAGSATGQRGGDYRSAFQEKYGTGDEAFRTYGPAYEYGYTTASNPQYRNRQFSDVEPELQRSYEQRYPNSTWEQMKDAVRNGWDRVTGKASGTTTGSSAGSTTGQKGDYRSAFQEKYGTGDEAYQTYGPAYEYGYTSASNPQYRNRQFSDVEPELRRSYEQRYPNSTWEKMKDAVRNGWDRVTGKA